MKTPEVRGIDLDLIPKNSPNIAAAIFENAQKMSEPKVDCDPTRGKHCVLHIPISAPGMLMTKPKILMIIGTSEVPLPVS